MPANADLSTGTRAGVRKPPKNETAGSRAPGGSACAMGNWLAPLPGIGPKMLARQWMQATEAGPHAARKFDYEAIVLTWNLGDPILPSPVVASR